MRSPRSISLPTVSVGEIASAVAEGELSAVQLACDTLERIRTHDPEINAFTSLTEECALRDAERIDALGRNARRSLPLAGVPLAAKDMFVVPGRDGTSTAASRLLEGFRAPGDYQATCLKRLRDAGAVLVGKTNQDEFAMGSSGEHSAFGPTRNPADLETVPGGSSSGSAAAVAAGLVPCSIGTDTGGSIRQPAALTGTVGVKPTYGRVSRYGVIAFASSLDQAGPITRNVRDAALLLRVMAGRDERDATSADVEVADYLDGIESGVKGLKIGLPREYYTPEVQPAVGDALERVRAGLESAGAETTVISLPHTEHAVAAYYIIAPSEASSNLARYDGVRYGRRAEAPHALHAMYCASRAEGFGEEVKRRIMLGTFALSTGYYEAFYEKAQRVRTLIVRDFMEAFSRVDVLLTPAMPTTAWPLGERLEDPLAMYLSDVFTVPASLAGICGLSVPCGSDERGRPIGAQLLAGHFLEPVLFRAARGVEEIVA